MAATAAWMASVNSHESVLVEDWLTALHQVDAEARALCGGLLTRHPQLLYKDASRTCGVVAALLEATRDKALLRPWALEDAQVLALADRYTPDSLRARLRELHRAVWSRLDDPAAAPAFLARRTSLDALDLQAAAAALTAGALAALAPGWAPSALLGACPELLASDCQPGDLHGRVRQVGRVLVLGEGVVGVEVAGASGCVIVSVRTRLGRERKAGGEAGAVGKAGRLLRTARCGAQALLTEGAGGAREEEAVVVTRVFPNVRSVVWAGPEGPELRLGEPAEADVQAVGVAVQVGVQPAAAMAVARGC